MSLYPNPSSAQPSSSDTVSSLSLPPYPNPSFFQNGPEINRILGSKIEDDRLMYDVEWIDQFGRLSLSCEIVGVLYPWMRKVVEFQIGLKERQQQRKKQMEEHKQTSMIKDSKLRMPLDQIAEVPEHEESSNPNPTKKKPQNSKYQNLSLINITGIPTQKNSSDLFYQVQLMDKKSHKLTYEVMTARQLRQEFLGNYVRYLEKSVYYPLAHGLKK